MNISSVLMAVLRRWYLALVVLAGTGYLALQLWEQAEPEYTSSSVVSVVASPDFLAAQQSEDPLVVVTNPYGTQAASTLASILADSVGNGNVALPPEAEGAVLEVVTNPSRAESFFTVSATAPDADAAVAAVLALEEQAPLLLADVQTRAGAPADQLYTSLLARPATAAVEAYPDRARLVLGTVLAGLLATALLCVLLDGIVLAVRAARRRRGERRAAVRAAAAREEAQRIEAAHPRPGVKPGEHVG